MDILKRHLNGQEMTSVYIRELIRTGGNIDKLSRGQGKSNP